MDKKRIEIKNEADIVLARQAGRKMAQSLGFGPADQTRLATAISELTRNVIQYAQQGIFEICDQSNRKAIIIRVMVEDFGPGIADLDKAMEYGFSTSQSLGVGLPAAKKLVHKFSIKSKPGHTKVTMVMTRKRV